ncbi:MAG: MprA protease, GlyGly-CTERM protein-sorting domain-containing form [Planctomycetota bacterium]
MFGRYPIGGAIPPWTGALLFSGKNAYDAPAGNKHAASRQPCGDEWSVYVTRLRERCIRELERGSCLN